MKGDNEMTSKAEPKRLAQFGLKNRDMATEHIDDLLGIELTIRSGSFKTGEHGEFAVFEATDEEGVSHTIVSGAGFVLDALHDAAEQKAFPVCVKFYKSGRTVLFT